MDLASFDWLLGDDGQVLLGAATALGALVVDDPLTASATLRRTSASAGATDPSHVAAALTQAALRRRAAAKMGELAGRMYFTPDGLEQATRLPVARHRAARLRAFGARTLVDLGCGIGGDLVASAEAGTTVAGVDLDPVRVAVARANLTALDLPGAVAVADATTVDHRGFDVTYADPARRTARGRSFAVDDWTPPWPFVQGLLARDSCVKVAPGIPHALVPDDVEAEWVSDRGEVKEAALWSGRLATTRRRATVIGQGGLATLTEDDDPGAPVVPLAAYVGEPDGAVVRAGLVTAVAARTGGGLLDEHIAYVTSETWTPTPFARGYRVLEELPYREKALKAALRERGIGSLTIKKRGVDIVPEELRKRLDLRGDETATLVMTRVAGVGTALLVQPV